MPRVSRRNLIRPLDLGALVDFSGKGAQVSDDVQLVYVLDDIRESLYAYGAIGEFTPAAAGRIHLLQIQCRNRRGLIIDELVGVHAGGTNSRLNVKCNTQDAAEPNIIPAGGQPEPLGISEGLPTKAVAVSGTVPSGQFDGGRPGFTVSFAMNPDNVFCGLPGALVGLFIGFNRFLVMLSDASNAGSQWSLRWHELGD